jgi:MFS family permease
MAHTVTAPALRPEMPERGSTAYVVLLAAVAALGGLLFGYDTAVISGVIGPLTDHFRLNPVEEGWAAACVLVGCAFGAAMAGGLSDRLGRKKMLVIAAVLFFLSAVGTALPVRFYQYIAFRFLGGLAIGAASMTSPMYIAEISPARIRGRMVSLNQLAIVTGMVVVYFVNFAIAAYGTRADQRLLAWLGQAQPLEPQFVRQYVAHKSPKTTPESVKAWLAGQKGPIDGRAVADFLKRESPIVKDQSLLIVAPSEIELRALDKEPWNVREGWRWMFGSGAFPAAAFLLLLFLVPESPRWLAKQDRRDEALAVLSRVGGSRQARVELAEIDEAIAQESGSLAQLLQPGMRVALVIGVTLAVLQQVTGINVILYYAPEIFKKLGTPQSVALLQTLLIGCVNAIFTILAIWTVDRLGRKPLMLIGSTGMGLALLALGCVFFFRRTEVWTLALFLSYIACFAMSVGPVVWVILSEIFPTRIRGRAMALATICLWVANFLVTQTFTMMDENPWLVDKLHHAFPFWIYSLLCGVTVVFVWRFVPETKGKSLEEIERSWGEV